VNAVESNGIENLKTSGIGIKVNGIGMESQLKIQNFSITIQIPNQNRI
jgi:hypothetical protein